MLWLHCSWSPCYRLVGRSAKSELQSLDPITPRQQALRHRSASPFLTYHFCFALQCSANDFIGLVGRSPGKPSHMGSHGIKRCWGASTQGPSTVRPHHPGGSPTVEQPSGSKAWLSTAVFAAGSAGVVVGLLCHPTTFCNPTICCLLSSRYNSKSTPEMTTRYLILDQNSESAGITSASGCK